MQNTAKVQNCARLLSEAFGALFTADLADRGAGLVLGTGLGDVADSLKNPIAVSFTELSGFPGAGVASHAGRFIAGYLHEVPVLVQQGRIHLYEGHSPQDVCLATRIMGALKVRRLVLTNAAGALNPLFDAGDVMLISDHINFTGKSPLTGPNDETLGPRFPDMSAAYDAEYKKLARSAALEA
ncbi:purine-nucleoside phosphorylase, partial [Desulfovibrio sp. OttesenSCG-928-I05]|nr:purine-nucleoside phosphorylase [Desulfovibrio sp. OttesenSCG-928-I05]